MPLAANQQLYEYRIARVLGQGGFGTVYLAHDTLLDRLVAIKGLVVTRQTDEQAFKRFLQEARTAGGLNHPNVVTVHALKVDGPNVYLVMEYVGDSLRGLLDKQGKLDIEQAVRITILHPAWQAHLIEALTDMCRQYDAQMIIATHSEEVARSLRARVDSAGRHLWAKEGPMMTPFVGQRPATLFCKSHT